MKKGKVSSLEQFFAESFGREVWIDADIYKRSYSLAVCRDDDAMVSWKKRGGQ